MGSLVPVSLSAAMVLNGTYTPIPVFVLSISSGILLPGTAKIFLLASVGEFWTPGIIVFALQITTGMGKDVHILLVLVDRCGLVAIVHVHQGDISMVPFVSNVSMGKNGIVEQSHANVQQDTNGQDSSATKPMTVLGIVCGMRQ
jgi:hypothetical protein